ncbi:hypothetical protein LQZ19_05235 [Treponema primitia]|uniref:hypothetical protein n=1 Tax=Treponema primitia TaxID=88058 RepID=UPI003980F733
MSEMRKIIYELTDAEYETARSCGVLPRRLIHDSTGADIKMQVMALIDQMTASEKVPMFQGFAEGLAIAGALQPIQDKINASKAEEQLDAAISAKITDMKAQRTKETRRAF